MSAIKSPVLPTGIENKSIFYVFAILLLLVFFLDILAVRPFIDPFNVLYLDPFVDPLVELRADTFLEFIV